MGVYHIRGGHVSLIARSNAKHSMRSGASVVFMFLTLITGLLIANGVLTPVEMVEASAEKIGGKEAGKEATKVVLEKAVDATATVLTSWTGADAEQVTYLTKTKPALMSAILAILLFFIPGLITLGAFNQTAGDIQHKGLRYLLFRTERSNIFVGRLIGTMVFTLITMLMLMAIIVIYLIAKVSYYPPGEVILWALQGYFAVIMFSLPYIAFCAWISAANDSPAVSMIVSQAVWFLPMLIWIASRAQEKLSYLGYLTPFPIKYWLISPSIVQVLGGCAIMLAFTGLFTFLGLRTFQTRDL